MHKSVRLLFLGLLIVGLLPLNCHKATPNALRVININDGKAINVDVADHWTYDEEGEPVEVITPGTVIVPIEIAYTEQGSGLPTYPGPYTALINKYTVTYKDITTGTETEIGEKVVGTCNYVITADPEMKNTVIRNIDLMPFNWIDANLSDLEGTTEERIIKAVIRFEGMDQLSGSTVSDSGYATINAADFEDDPNKQGE